MPHGWMWLGSAKIVSRWFHVRIAISSLVAGRSPRHPLRRRRRGRRHTDVRRRRQRRGCTRTPTRIYGNIRVLRLASCGGHRPGRRPICARRHRVLCESLRLDPPHVAACRHGGLLTRHLGLRQLRRLLRRSICVDRLAKTPVHDAKVSPGG